MLRASVLASIILRLTIAAVSAEEARQKTCTGSMIEPTAFSQSSQTVKLSLTLDLG
jgi:hypothetical protein